MLCSRVFSLSSYLYWSLYSKRQILKKRCIQTWSNQIWHTLVRLNVIFLLSLIGYLYWIGIFVWKVLAVDMFCLYIVLIYVSLWGYVLYIVVEWLQCISIFSVRPLFCRCSYPIASLFLLISGDCLLSGRLCPLASWLCRGCECELGFARVIWVIQVFLWIRYMRFILRWLVTSLLFWLEWEWHFVLLLIHIERRLIRIPFGGPDGIPLIRYFP